MHEYFIFFSSFLLILKVPVSIVFSLSSYFVLIIYCSFDRLSCHLYVSSLGYGLLLFLFSTFYFLLSTIPSSLLLVLLLLHHWFSFNFVSHLRRFWCSFWCFSGILSLSIYITIFFFQENNNGTKGTDCLYSILLFSLFLTYTKLCCIKV